jgi:hypothetical protein
MENSFYLVIMLVYGLASGFWIGALVATHKAYKKIESIVDNIASEEKTKPFKTGGYVPFDNLNYRGNCWPMPPVKPPREE